MSLKNSLFHTNSFRMDINPTLLSQLETLLFASGDPQTMDRLAKTLGVESDVFASALEALESRYRLPESGLLILHLGNRIQLGTKGENSVVIEHLREGELQETLSRATLETLAVIAYRAPVTRADIDAIRGVNSNFTLRHLLIRGLIEREGNPLDARGYVYRPTFDFLKALGMETIADLPEYDLLSQNERLEALLTEKLPAENEGEGESVP